MGAAIEFLSGGIPGGFILLILILLSINLTLLFLKSSKIISREQSFKNQFRLTLVLVLLYIGLWVALRPPLPKERIVVLPTIAADGNFVLDGSAFKFADFLQQNGRGRMSDRYLMHRWKWLYETLGRDSVGGYENWMRVGQRLEPGILIESRFEGRKIICRVYLPGETDERPKEYSADFPAGLKEITLKINDDFDIFNGDDLNETGSPDYLLDARLAILTNEYQLAKSLLENHTSGAAQILRAAILVKKGLTRKIDREKSKFVKIENPEFDQARAVLYQVLRDREDTAELAYLLGRMDLRQEEYPKAEISLKKALADDPTNCRIHYALSYLSPMRLQEIGFAGRVEMLEKAVYLDPGYRDAVYQLADHYYHTGTGTQTGAGTSRALAIAENFLKIKGGDAQILSLLGSIYIKTMRYEEAYQIFSGLLKRFPGDSNVHYNMGVVLFMEKKYDQALAYFMKAIGIDHNLDSYLYAGVIHNQRGDLDKALEYFRERVSRKTGDDDTYAREAMLGIRKILAAKEENAKDEN